MNATIHPFPPQGDSPNLPSLEEMFNALRNNYALLDEIDRDFFACIDHVYRLGNNAKIEAITDSRAIAFSMMNRYGVKV